MKQNLLGLDAAGLERFFEAQGEKRFRARQLLRWIHQRGEADFAQMSDLARELREKLSAIALVEAPRIVGDTAAADGTRKWLLKVDDANAVEAVFIPEARRGTLCVSSQAGCVLDCAFCSTGKQGFNRYLGKAPRDFITFEYVMLDGVNDSDAHARELVGFAGKVRSKFNLIPFNPFPNSGFRRSPPERIRRFAEVLQRAGLTVTTRKTRGDDIAAACGQLAGDVADRTRRRIALKEVRA